MIDFMITTTTYIHTYIYIYIYIYICIYTETERERAYWDVHGAIKLTNIRKISNSDSRPRSTVTVKTFIFSSTTYK